MNAGNSQGEQGGLVFARHEIKYRVPADLYGELAERTAGILKPDLFPESHVLSLYYDTDHFDLISRSLMSPPYKEKLRLRSYSIPGPDTMVFPELKKKYKGTVYKRRAMMPYRQAQMFLDRGILSGEDGQILREIAGFRDFYKPHPSVFIAYERRSFVGTDSPGLRVTFDRNIRYRTERLRLDEGDDGAELDPGGDCLMEVKVQNAIPLELVRVLSALRLYPVSFSKYGTIYTRLHDPDKKKGVTGLCLPVS